uniref:Si:dkeyp-117b11.2 n=1 Tax=Nothobranchius pienaari TaxID=704102 RepID=A0A1A8LJR3_9TELE
MTFHLTTCPNKSNVIQPTLENSSADHSYRQAASPKTLTPATDFDQTTATTSEKPTIQEREVILPLTKAESDEVIQKLLRNRNANAVHFQDLSRRVGGHFHPSFCDSTITTKDLTALRLATCPDKSNVIQPTLVESYKFCVCRCNLSADHFHCPYCDDTIIRKEDMILHLNVCPNKNKSAQSTLVEPDHSYAKAALPKTPTPVTDFDQTTPATTSDQLMIQEEEVTVPLTNVHESIIRKDTDLKQSLLTSGFECPLFPNFKTQSDGVIQTHLSNHIANGVHFQENIICRCNLPCRAGDHFHCPFCDKTLTTKDSMALHLIRCQNKSTVVQPALVEPPPETQPLIDHLEPSGSEDHSVSSQTADHAYTQTPTLITAFDQTTPATTSDQLMVQDVEVHKSITWKDTYLERTLLPSGFGCPLCPHFNSVNDDVIQRHLRNHNENGVHFQEIVICRCNLSCRVKSHFHCPFCDSTIIRKDNVPLHLKACHKNGPLDLRKLLVSCKPSLPETQPFKDILEPSVNEDHYTSSQTADYSYSQTASLKTPTFATDFDQRAPATSTDQPMIEEEEVTVPKAHVKCPHCLLILYRQNLAIHIKRKHSKLEDIAEKSQLKSLCIDQSKDSKASHGLNVQPKAWSLQHHTKSEMKVCCHCQHHLLFQHSGLCHSMCHRICSGDYLSSMAPMPLTNTKFSTKWRKTRLHYVNIAML